MNKSMGFVLIVFFCMVFLVHASEVKFLTPDTLYFGDVESGQTVKGEIQFLNSGDDQVQIQKVHTSCGCTVVDTDKMIYDPGETATISFVLNTRGFKGQINKSITVEFVNSNPPSKSIKLIANCIDYLEVRPRYLTFTKIPVNADTVIQRDVILMNRYKVPIMLKAIHTDADVKIKYKKIEIAPGEEYIFHVLLTPRAPYQKNTQIYIESDSKNMEPLRIPLYINVKG